MGAHVLCRWVPWGRRCISSPSLFTIASVKTEDTDMPQCCVVPAGCTCQIALRAGPLWPPPDVKHQWNLGFLHLHATPRCQVGFPIPPEGVPGHVHC